MLSTLNQSLRVHLSDWTWHLWPLSLLRSYERSRASVPKTQLILGSLDHLSSSHWRARRTRSSNTSRSSRDVVVVVVALIRRKECHSVSLQKTKLQKMKTRRESYRRPRRRRWRRRRWRRSLLSRNWRSSFCFVAPIFFFENRKRVGGKKFQTMVLKLI